MSLIPVNTFSTEIEIKKSRFINFGFQIDSPEEARLKLKELRVKFPDARHICYAFLWGVKSTHMGMSDDGEPNGTAGRPMLEVLKGSGYENILVAVVRYFGGIKLGTGGLVKAYTEATKSIVDGIDVEEYVEKCLVELSTPYNLFDNIKIVIEQNSGEITSETFLTDIELKITLPKKCFNKFKRDIMDASSGLINVCSDLIPKTDHFINLFQT